MKGLQHNSEEVIPARKGKVERKRPQMLKEGFAGREQFTHGAIGTAQSIQDVMQQEGKQDQGGEE